METKLVELMDALMKAAQQIGMEGIRLWPQMVRITFIGSLASLMLSISLLCVGLAGLRLVLMADWVKAGSYDDTVATPQWKRIVVGCVLGLIGCGALFALCGNLPNWMAGILSPEAKTVLDLAAKIK